MIQYWQEGLAKHSNPNVTIQVKDKRIQAVAEVAGPEKKSALWSQLLKVAPGFAAYQQRTSREIPMVILHPLKEAA